MIYFGWDVYFFFWGGGIFFGGGGDFFFGEGVIFLEGIFLGVGGFFLQYSTVQYSTRREGGIERGKRGPGLAQIVWSTLLLRGRFHRCIWRYYRCIVCDFPAVHWIFFERKKVLTSGLEHLYSSRGKVFLGCQHFIGEGPLLIPPPLAAAPRRRPPYPLAQCFFVCF